MKRLLFLALLVPSVALADPSGINWRDGTRLTAGMLQQFDNAKVNTVNGTRLGGADNGTDLKMGVAKSLQVGSVSRTLAEYFSDTINVRNFGAKCDVGTASTPTDDTQAIQAAFTAAQALDHVRVILPGMCEITSTINTTVGNHLAIQGGGLYVNGTQPVDGVNITIQGKGKFDISSVRFKPGPRGAGRALTIIGNGGDIEDNSDLINNVTVTTSDETTKGVGFKNGIYLYGIVAYINNYSVTFPQIYLLNGKETTVNYTDPDTGVGLTFAGSPAGASYTLNGGGSIVSNMQGNGGFADIRFTGMSQGGIFNNIVSNWQTHLVYAGQDVVSPQSFTFNSPASQTGWWSSADGILFDFEVTGGQYIINGGIFAGPAISGKWTVLKCFGCKAVQFSNNQVNQNYPSSAAILDSGPSGSNATGWIVQNNTFGAPNNAAQLSAATDVLNFSGLKSASELLFTGNYLGLVPPPVMPAPTSGAGGNLLTSSGNVWHNVIRKAGSGSLGETPFIQGRLSADWSIDAKLHGSASILANGTLTLTLDGKAEAANNALSTIRPFNSVGAVVTYDALVSCYEWADNPAKYFAIFRATGAYSITPGGTDTYALLGQSSTTSSSLYSSAGEAFTARFVLSASTKSPALQVVNTGTAQVALTCSANVRSTNLQ